MLAELLTIVREIEGVLKSHMHDNEMNQQALVERLEHIATGFPGNDPEGHRIFHEAYIRKLEERAAFWRKMTFELSKYGLMGFLGWAAYALWKAFLMGPK